MWTKRREEGLKVTDHWHEYMLSVTILTLTIRLSATCSVFPILDEWTVDHVTVTLGNYLGFIKILTWSWQLLSKNIKVQQFEVSGSTRTLCHNVPVDSYKKKSCLIPSENKMRNGKRGLMLAFSGVISAHSVPICAQIQPAHLWRKKKDIQSKVKEKDPLWHFWHFCFFSSGGNIALHSLMCFERIDHKIEAETFTVGWHINNTPERLGGSR